MILGLFCKNVKFVDQTGRQIFLFFRDQDLVQLPKFDHILFFKLSILFEKGDLIPSHLGSSPGLIGMTIKGNFTLHIFLNFSNTCFVLLDYASFYRPQSQPNSESKIKPKYE